MFTHEMKLKLRSWSIRRLTNFHKCSPRVLLVTLLEGISYTLSVRQ